LQNQENEKGKGWKRESYMFLKRKIHSALPTSMTCCLKGEAVKRTYLCEEQGHALIGFLQHGINTPDRENQFPFTTACTLHKGWGTYMFSDAGCAKVQRSPESGFQNYRGRAKGLFQETNVSPGHTLWFFHR
jgi:hypothetical protein